MGGRHRLSLPGLGAPVAHRLLWVAVLVLVLVASSILASPPASASARTPSSGAPDTLVAPVAPLLAPPVHPTTLPVGPADRPLGEPVRALAHPGTSVASPPPPPLLPATPSATILPAPGQPVTGIVVGESPQGVAYDPANHWIYVTITSTNSVAIINGTTVIASVAVGNYPANAVYDPLNQYVYVTDYTSDAVSVINGTKLLTTIHMSSSSTAGPFGIANNPVNGWTYVTEYNGGVVGVIKGLVLSANISVQSGPDSIAYNSNGELYVACYNTGTVDVISGTKVLDKISVGGDPEGVAFDSTNGYIYVTDEGSAQVSVISSNQVIATISVGPSPQGIAFDSGNGYVYVADFSANNLTVINTTRNVATIPVGGHPYDIAYDAYNGCLYVTRQNGNSVLLVSTLLVQGSLYAAPLGKPSDSADVGQSVVFNATVWYLGNGNLSAKESISPSSGLGCSPEATFSYGSGIGELRWACHPLNATVYTIGFNVTDLTGTTVSTHLNFRVFADPNASSPDVYIGYRNYLSMVDVGQVVNISEEATGGTGTFTSFLWETFPIDMCVNASTPNPVCVFTREFAIPFTLKVLVTDSNGAESSSPIIQLAVNPMPVASAPTVDRTAADIGQSLNFSTIVTGGSGAITYQWFGLPSNCRGTGSPSPYCAPKVASTYSVSVVVTDSVGGTSPRTAIVSTTVFADPKVTGVTVSPTTVTVGNPLLITARVTGGWGNYTFTWSGLPPGCSGRAETISCRPDTVGTDKLSLNVSDQNLFTSQSKPVTVRVVPLPVLVNATGNGTPWEIYGMPGAIFFAYIGSLAISIIGIPLAVRVGDERRYRSFSPPPDPTAAREPEPPP